MTGAKEKTVSKSKSELKLWLMILAGLVILAAAYALSIKTPAPLPEIQASPQAQPEAAGEQASSVVMNADIDVVAAKAERILGDTSAPIKITEHASLTCSHCAHFHKESFDLVKKNLIDTGKAYLVFSDFPLNAPALHATMIARCLPQEKFFDFIGALFKEQENWSGESGYADYLKIKAGEFGMSGEKVDACLKSTELQNAILEKMKAVQKQWTINSTPSFVINNQEVISGAFPYEEFAKKLDEAVEKINNPQAAPQSSPSEEPSTRPGGE